MKVVVFDIDGTLTDTNHADGLAFQETFQSLHKISNLSTDWGSYKYSTDSGIVDEIFRTQLGRLPSTQDLQSFIQFFVNRLTHFHRENSSWFSEIPGAKVLLENLPAAGWMVAIATGAWKQSALFKLTKAQIPHRETDAAFAEDSFERADVIQTAVKRLGLPSSPTRVVYVGDGRWDRKAAITLKIPFIHRSESPTGPGVGNYLNIENFLMLLDSVPVAIDQG
jgi:phosphoglycolate phosphatase-like HAD superfamily hydrolase